MYSLQAIGLQSKHF